MPNPRPSILQMRPYRPPTDERGQMLRLDFNENTAGCPGSMIGQLVNELSPELLATYPDYEEAQSHLAAFFGVSQDQLLIANGTDEAIQLLVNTYVEPGDEVVVLQPTYAMYRFYSEIAAAEVKEVSFLEAPGNSNCERVLTVRLEDILLAVSRKTKAIFLPNPNNPTGSTIDIETVKELLTSVPNVCVLIDEAYFDFWGVTALPLIARFDNLFVSRTFSKAFGLAGIRCGCLMSKAENIAIMKKAQSPYSVNALATVAVMAAIQDRKWVDEYVSQALDGRKLLEAGLKEHSFSYWKSDANFVLFNAVEFADLILQKCREAGILIRDRRNDLPGALRVTAGTPSQIQRFLGVLEEVR